MNWRRWREEGHSEWIVQTTDLNDDRLNELNVLMPERGEGQIAIAHLAKLITTNQFMRVQSLVLIMARVSISMDQTTGCQLIKSERERERWNMITSKMQTTIMITITKQHTPTHEQREGSARGLQLQLRHRRRRRRRWVLQLNKTHRVRMGQGEKSTEEEEGEEAEKRRDVGMDVMIMMMMKMRGWCR